MSHGEHCSAVTPNQVPYCLSTSVGRVNGGGREAGARAALSLKGNTSWWGGAPGGGAQLPEKAQDLAKVTE